MEAKPLEAEQGLSVPFPVSQSARSRADLKVVGRLGRFKSSKVTESV